MNRLTNEESFFEVLSNVFGDAKGDAVFFADGDNRLESRDYDEIVEALGDGASLTLVTSKMEILGIAAESIGEFPTPTFIVGHEERDFEFNVWLFKTPVDFTFGSKLSLGLEAAAKKLDENSHIGSQFPVPGVNGWDFIGDVGPRWDVAEFLDAVGIDADSVQSQVEKVLFPSGSNNAESDENPPDVTVREQSSAEATNVTDGEQLKIGDALIYGDFDDAFLATKLKLGVSVKGAKTKPGEWQNAELTVTDLLLLLSEHEQGAKDGKCILQGEVIDGERKAQSVRACHILMLDLDTGEDLQDTIKKLQQLGLAAAVWTTHSHLKPSTSIRKDAVVRFIKEKREPNLDDVKRYLLEVKRYRPYIIDSAALGPAEHTKEGLQLVVNHLPMPKFRVMFFLSKPFVFADFLDNRTANEAWKAAYERTSDMLGAFYDKACTDPSRLMYTPRHGEGAKGYSIHFIAGKPLDLDAAPAPADARQAAFSAAAAQTSVIDKRDVKSSDYQTSWLRGFLAKNSDVFQVADFFEAYGEPRGPRNGAGAHYRCPNDDEHTNAGDPEDKGFYCVNAGEGDYVEGFIAKCMHASCAEKHRGHMLDLMVVEHDLSEEDLNQFCDEALRPDQEPAKQEAPKQQAPIVLEAEEGDEDQTDSDDDYTASSAYDEPHIKRAMQTMNKEWAVVTLGTDVRIMREPKQAGKMPSFHGIEAFRNLYSNKKINVPVEGGYKAVPVTKLWLEWPQRRTFFDGVIFEPEEQNPDAYNLWRGYPTQAKRGSWSMLREHVYDNICAGDEERFNWFMTWLAQIVQFPGRKMGSAVAIKGLKGTGKSKLFEWVKKGLGNHAIKVSQKKHIVGDFNGHHKGVTLMVCEEAFWAGDHAAGNALKDLITSDTMMFEQKGIDAVPISNYVRLAFISNEHWIVPAGLEDERRYFVMECKDTRRGDIPFFIAIDEQMENGGLEAMWYELSNWDAHELYPEKGWNILRTPPMTEELVDQAMETIEAWDKFFIGFIEDGKLEASSHPDLPEIILEDDETNHVSITALRLHFEAYLTHLGGNARHKLGNRGFLKKQAIKYLGIEDKSVAHRFGGEVVRCYKCPPLPEIRARITQKLKIKLDLPD